MIVNNRGRLVLMGLLADERHLAHQAVSGPDGLTRQQRGRYRLRIAEARAGWVPIDLVSWLGREPTNSERVMFHRAYLHLEDLGLIERCNRRGGRRTTHLRLTAGGRCLAEDLLAESEDEHDIEPVDLAAIEFAPIDMPAERRPAEAEGKRG